MSAFPRRALALAVIATAGIGLSACESIRSAAGQGKNSPDEFAVVTKPALVVPPDFNLKPPTPGAAPVNQIDPTTSAETALYGASPATVAASLPPTMSQGERILLANAHVENTDPGIRQEIAADGRSMRGGDEGFTNSILFGSSPAANGNTPVDPDAEAHRLANERGGAAAPSAPPTAGTPPPPPATPPADNDKDSGGWFDWF